MTVAGARLEGRVPHGAGRGRAPGRRPASPAGVGRSGSRCGAGGGARGGVRPSRESSVRLHYGSSGCGRSRPVGPERKPMLTHPRLSVLYTSDQQRTLDFLTEALGFRLEVDTVHQGGQRWVEVHLPGSQTSVALAQVDSGLLEEVRSRVGRMAQGWFNCDDLDAVCENLRGQGVEILTEPQDTAWRKGNRWAQISGWDGNVYGLIEGGR
ncbi:Glyoxalase-like domain [Nocardiopsis dassonvillei]|uniref:Glyoxalase/bleomycin resistance protein/dioxygenase n=3 Tax=Nocardiopsidaceae TaxID=83676 RepID=D7B898_NOCDD|nr:Glyoxalase/bleomycin resistance protein/dioxygenase [Nocardiopsis dassonvillei subsp. dassonvillei DSM 43111]VEI91315.1 Glyoxalase-like domain [Nocardiopsis dassonvillei]